jgi:hypothetical protein
MLQRTARVDTGREARLSVVVHRRRRSKWRHHYEPELLGLTLRVSVPVAGGGGSIVTAVFTLTPTRRDARGSWTLAVS